jgi:hypothetical protein
MSRKKKRSTCPNEHEHTDLPEGYLDRAFWVEQMARTHDQLQCPGCGLWAIWKVKA